MLPVVFSHLSVPSPVSGSAVLNAHFGFGFLVLLLLLVPLVLSSD